MTAPARCRLCHAPGLAPVPFAVPPGYGSWHRCAACGSDTSEARYEDVRPFYTADYLAAEVAATGGDEIRRREVESNCEWFGHHHDRSLPRDFLDVACLDGAALTVMQNLGWAVHGWDVLKPPYAGPHVTVSPHFSRWHFPQRYAAVLARECFEHNPTPDLFLHDLHGVCRPGGLVQVQTPRPTGDFNPIGYQAYHLFLASPARLKAMLAAAMLDVIDERHWAEGQAYLARARR